MSLQNFMNASTSDTQQLKIVKLASGYSGTTSIGEPLAYDADTTVDINGDSVTEGDLNSGRYQIVETPADGNKHAFAGVCAESGKAADEFVRMWVPDSQSYIPVLTDQNCTAGETVLAIEDDTQEFTGLVGGVAVALAKETVDRSSTSGLVLAQVYPTPLNAESEAANTDGRAATALPTDTIWDNFSRAELRSNPFAGSLLETDFRDGKHRPESEYVSATYAATAEGKSPTEYITLGPGATGELEFFMTTDNQVAEAQWGVPITVSGGKPWAFEARVKVSTIEDSDYNLFFGLLLPQKLNGDLITDVGALIDGGAIGFQSKEADGNVLDFIYDENSQTQNEHDDNYATLVADTYTTLAMHFDGTTIQGYVDGVAVGTAISASDISAADFPTGAVLVPTVAVKSAAADDETITFDWIIAAQQAAA